MQECEKTGRVAQSCSLVAEFTPHGGAQTERLPFGLSCPAGAGLS